MVRYKSFEKSFRTVQENMFSAKLDWNEYFEIISVMAFIWLMLYSFYVNWVQTDELFSAWYVWVKTRFAYADYKQNSLMTDVGGSLICHLLIVHWKIKDKLFFFDSYLLQNMTR